VIFTKSDKLRTPPSSLLFGCVSQSRLYCPFLSQPALIWQTKNTKLHFIHSETTPFATSFGDFFLSFYVYLIDQQRLGTDAGGYFHPTNRYLFLGIGRASGYEETTARQSEIAKRGSTRQLSISSSVTSGWMFEWVGHSNLRSVLGGSERSTYRRKYHE
jgi:hypothetical protein